MNFTAEDKAQITSYGLTLQDIQQQLELFSSGINYVNLYKAATIGDGIVKLTEDSIAEKITLFESRKKDVSIIKFVPASGAATRMFKFLFQFLKDYRPIIQSLNAYINRNNARRLSLFLVGLEKFPFYNTVISKITSNNIDFQSLNTNEKAHVFIKTMLEENQLDYGNTPKGLFPFHKYKDSIATAFEEHLFEMAHYGTPDNPLKLHFTILEKHKHKFAQAFKNIEERIEEDTGYMYEISFSFQHKSTDTIALHLNDQPFRLDDGSLYFRPAGHGALLKNLNQLKEDLILVSNIDNVVIKTYKAQVAKYRKMMMGMLLEVQEQLFSYIKLLQNEKEITEQQLHEIAEFLNQRVNVSISEEFEKYSYTYQVEYLLEKLNRPLRVCGMVKNEGEPGGGPFWVKDESGKVSLQIVESAQINQQNRRQKEILEAATHFNPVDIVCSIKSYNGEIFDLQKFVDKKAAFITTKTKGNQQLKALELPGLWNGSMAHWNTIFVEVPIQTFNPVKTVNDLLKGRHQIQ